MLPQVDTFSFNKIFKLLWGQGCQAQHFDTQAEESERRKWKNLAAGKPTILFPRSPAKNAGFGLGGTPGDPTEYMPYG